MKNKTEFTKFMLLASELYDRKLSKSLTELYWLALEPYSDDECIMAFQTILKTSKFFPKVADLLEVLEGPQNSEATIAWIDVLDAVKKIGPWESVQFADPVIHSVLEVMGGWVAICDMASAEVKWKQKEFEQFYSLLRQRNQHREYLPGIHEITNGHNGFVEYIKPPVRIGGDRRQISLSGGDVSRLVKCM